MSILSIFLGILTFVLILVSVFLILVVLAQKAKSDGGMGAAMGGGMAEAAFGADTGNVLSKSTIYAAILFFALALTLYLGRIYESKHMTTGGALPIIPVSAGAAPISSVPLAPGTTPAASTMTMTVPVTATPAPAAEPVKKP